MFNTLLQNHSNNNFGDLKEDDVCQEDQLESEPMQLLVQMISSDGALLFDNAVSCE